MKENVMELLTECSLEELEEIRTHLSKVIDGECIRCGRILSVTQHLDYVGRHSEGKICMPCMGGSF